MANVNLNDSSIDAFLNDPLGPVGDLLDEMATEGAEIARGLAPVKEGNLWNNAATRSSNSRPAGFTKATLHAKRSVSRQGKLYGSVNAQADPTIFLEYPAQQLHHKRPFLTTALWSITPI